MKDLINTLKGNILFVNVSDSLKKHAEKCNNVTEIYYLDKLKKKKYKYDTKGYQKNIGLNNLHKVFKKKSVNYTIINLDGVLDKKRELVKQSIRLTNKDIILYGKVDSYEYDRIVKMYKRYTNSVKVYKDYTIITINNKKYKTILNIIYYLGDILYDFIDLLGSGLMD